MHFLCLHGMGTNNEIFKLHTSAIRRMLGPEHTYDFVEGTIPCPPAPGVGELQSTTTAEDSPDNEDTGFYMYLDVTSIDSIQTALEDLADYVEAAGPFDGVMAFSQGAGLAAGLMIQQAQNSPIDYLLKPVFKCAIFFSGGIPGDPASLKAGKLRLMSAEQDGQVIQVPTAHIWGSKDDQYPDFGPVLAGLTSKENREVVIWDGGHEVPGLGGRGITEAVAAIKKTLQRATHNQ